MPSSERQKIHRERLCQLERLGFSMPFEFSLLSSRPSEVVVVQRASELDCPVIDLPDKQTLFVVWVSLWAERPGVRLYDFRFAPPWGDDAFLRLPNFASSHFGEYYRLPDGLEYPREDVLNFNFLKAGWRLPSTRVEGVLCSLSATPIPQEYRHGASIPVGLRFFGRAGHQLAETTVTLWVDRLTHHPQKTQQMEGTDKPSRALNATAKSATAPSPRPSLYLGPSGDTDLRAADQRRRKGSPPEAKVPAGGHGTGLFGE